MLFPIHPQGPEFSRVILGAWRWADKNSSEIDHEKLVNQAIELGITSIDHADLYGNYECERIFGRIMVNNSSLRDQLQIITKCGIKPVSDKFPERKLATYDTSQKHIIESVETSLRNLSTDHIDLLLIHRPNPLLDPHEVSAAFTVLKNAGKVKHFGLSNFSNEQFELLQSTLDFHLVTNQIELSLTCSDPVFDGTVDYLMTKQVGIMDWSPLGGGGIFSNNELIEKLKPMAAKYDTEVSSLLIAWLLKLPANNFPVIGTTNPKHLRQLSKAETIDLEREDWFQMLKFARGYDVP